MQISRTTLSITHLAPWLSLLLLSACVTINIYFPAAAAEQVADEIIQDIQGSEEKTPQPDRDSGASIAPWQQWTYRQIDQVLQLLVGSAQAASVNLEADTPVIRQLRAAMKKRYALLRPFYEQGYIGIQRDGFLTVRAPAQVPLKDRNRVNKLVQLENSDRKKLYQAIANANGHPQWFAEIKATFAGRWVAHALSGWWYQTAQGDWKQK